MNTSIRILALCLTIGVAPAGHAAKLYQCQDHAGETTFRDTPCAAGEETVRTRAMHPRASEPPADATPQAPAGTQVQPAGIAGTHLQLANLAQALSSLTPIKLLVTEYYQINGRWPAKLEELGFEPSTMHNQQISGVDLQPGGAIHAELTDLFGSRKRLTLRPRSAMGGTQLEWSCTANLPAQTLARLYGSPCQAEN